MRDYNLVRRKKKETCLMNFPLTMRDVFFSSQEKANDDDDDDKGKEMKLRERKTRNEGKEK